MIGTEERLRAALRAAADTVPPGTAPPLRLPDDPSAGARRGAFRRHWLHTLTPLAAAAAVAAAVIASLTLTSGVPTASSGGANSTAGPVALDAVPPYYVALTSAATPAPAVIRSTATGAVLATVKPPRPYGTFNFVSGAADDRTFILAAQRWWPITSGTRGLAAQNRDNTTAVTFFRLRFDPATRIARLVALHLRQKIPAASLNGMGVSADGSKLALAVDPAQIEVISLATGSARRWAWPASAHSTSTGVGNNKPSGQPVSWSADGRTVAFKLTTLSGGIIEVRLLDTSAPAGNLSSSSRQAVRFTGLGKLLNGPVGNALLTPDGTRIVTVTSDRGIAQTKVTEFPARSGPAITGAGAVHRDTGLPVWDVLWTSADGSTLIVNAGRSPAISASAVGVLRGGRFTPLPGAPVTTNDVAW
jgi:hypothetical protein